MEDDANKKLKEALEGKSCEDNKNFQGNSSFSIKETTNTLTLEVPNEKMLEFQDPGSPVMSKNRLKKLKKHEKYLEKKKTRKERRKEAKEKKRLALEKKRKQSINHDCEESLPVRKQIKLMSSEDALPLRVAIDLSFDHLMNERDIAKLIKQVQRSYAINRRAFHPLQLYLTSFGGDSEKCLAKSETGYKNWDVHIKTEALSDVFPKDEIVYLTSDSPNVLNTVDVSKVLVIGGLVDHNHHKGLCFELAIKQGFGHAQLPIAEYVKLNSRKVLTVNQVYEILIQYTETNDWKIAFYNVIPSRKLGTAQTSKNDEIGERNKLQDNSLFTNDNKLCTCDDIIDNEEIDSIDS